MNEADEQVNLLLEMFPAACAIEVTHCLSVVNGDMEKAAQLILHRQENGDSIAEKKSLQVCLEHRLIILVPRWVNIDARWAQHVGNCLVVTATQFSLQPHKRSFKKHAVVDDRKMKDTILAK